MILFSDTDRNIRHGQLHSSGAQLPCCTLLARTLSPFGPRLGEGRMAGSCLLMSKGLYIVVMQSGMGQGQLGEKQDREVQLFRPALSRNFMLAVPLSSVSAAVALESKSPFASFVPGPTDMQSVQQPPPRDFLGLTMGQRCTLSPFAAWRLECLTPEHEPCPVGLNIRFDT